MIIKYKIIIIPFLVFLLTSHVTAQSYRKVQNQPYADQKNYHFGFFLGFHTQDLIIRNTGSPSSNGETWYGNIPSYSPGFTVGVIADKYLNEYFNLRVSPGLYFGERRFVFIEESSREKKASSLKNSYLYVPMHIKFNGGRIHNARPYLLVGGYADMAIGDKRGEVIRLKRLDYGLDFGIGCNIYFPLFKLCPELRFSLGLIDIINKDKSDLTDPHEAKFRDALKSGKSRILSLIFNFE